LIKVLLFLDFCVPGTFSLQVWKTILKQNVYCNFTPEVADELKINAMPSEIQHEVYGVCHIKNV
jgi:hypothetical protein